MNATWEILTEPFRILGVDPFVRWFAKDHDGATLGGMSKTVENLEDTARILNNKGFDIFAHLNPTRPRVVCRANLEDTLAWSFMLVDIDPLGKPHKDAVVASIKTPLEHLQQNLDPGGNLAPAVIYTGRGVHMWLRLQPKTDTEWWFVGDAQRELLRRLLPAIGYRIDPLGDTARIVRLPGTINHKTGQTAELITAGGMEPPRISEMILTYGREMARPHGNPTEHCLDWRDVKDELTMRARLFLDIGAEEGTRHETFWHVCRALFEKGVRRDSAIYALEWGNQATVKKLSPREIRGIVEQVYGK